MGLEELKKHIMDDLNKKVEEIKRETKSEVDNILNEAKRKVDDYRKYKQEKLNKEKQDMTLREEALVELEGNKLIQEARREAIDDLFNELTKKLSSMKTDEKKKYYQSLLKKAEKEIDVSAVYVNKSDIDIVKSIAKNIVKNKDSIKEEEILGGIIAENKDGTIRVDYSFDSLLEEFRQKSLADISEKLFTN